MGIDYKRLISVAIFALLVGFSNYNNSIISAKTNTIVTYNNIVLDNLHLSAGNGYAEKGKVCIKASSRVGINKLIGNEQDVTHNSKPDLEDKSIFTFQVNGTDRFFKNAVAVDNNVLKQYQNRKAILCFHEYLEVTGGLGEISKKIREKIIKPNSNVCMVLSGHYSGSNKVIDKFDDNGDGVNDRSVYEILFDYQSIGEGGNGYIRLMHFDEEDKKIIFRNYSPILDDYDANVLDFPISNEEYNVSFSDLGLVPKEKKIATDYFEVSIYTNNQIGEIKNVKSGSKVTMQWNKSQDDITGWYAEVSDDFGGISRSLINCNINMKK